MNLGKKVKVFSWICVNACNNEITIPIRSAPPTKGKEHLKIKRTVSFNRIVTSMVFNSLDFQENEGVSVLLMIDHGHLGELGLCHD